ncbi:D-lactate dehydrogenase (cytochrome) [Tepidamorphus gemmatus]|uniref:D-lactate dehydrogenase (cytochrome) n=1 Tax=Tepidamorphus gemmatus TaxID=747076 RepID=A0A4R3MET7_9HYPH|nr:FAD-binding oxidoreductase [Tepidamorphus gemmatus]TCT11553.1 D-lactate dehydrogenase (cytochrome) [Tepidamorphus gemmatus]
MSASPERLASTHPVVEALIAELGDSVLADSASRDYYANDIFWQPGIRPLAIVMPETREAAASAVRIATGGGVAVVPRGGGMSYTKGYLPSVAEAIVMDSRRLDRVIEVNAADMYVSVEAGCTWAKVNEALEGTGLRTGYWGPLSGVNATVGGALSQNSAFFGSALNGTVAESVLGVTVVLADGSVVTTGSGGRKGAKPFTREGGPDLTGLFLGDNGAMGFKVAATLRLWPRPAETGYLSFGFRSMTDIAAAQVEMARERLVSEGFGIDRTKASHSASVNRISDGLRTLGNVARAGKTLLGGLKDAATVAAGGASFLQAHEFTLHLVVEARNAAELKTSMDRCRTIAGKYGVEIENTVPKVMRAKPFSPVRGMLGRDGERWVPIHAVFPLGDWKRVVEANDAFYAARREFMEKHGIVYSVMTMTVGTEFFLEPAYYWLDEITPLHAKSLGEDVVKPWRSRPANVEARQAVAELRAATQHLYASLGGVNWQVARDYPFRSVLAPETWALLEGVKQAVDPKGLMNPGALGLAVRH